MGILYHGWKGLSRGWRRKKFFLVFGIFFYFLKFFKKFFFKILPVFLPDMSFSLCRKRIEYVNSNLWSLYVQTLAKPRNYKQKTCQGGNQL